ncbi:MAG: relaxase/mobilization nuclease domain-containing protein, partial [Pseudorhodoplanes sp.]|nr:relaxase/mobilization nuclease domain-containing protein [Pseudorhodoplanes sp.]
RYVLHDKQADTNDRVEWVLTHNIAGHADDAWYEMHETWRNQAKLKENAGLSARGRKNTAPVLHYTLSWHEDDQPDRQDMTRAALASLKALGLAEHEALIVAHDDTKHRHVHIVANTVHPYTGRTAELKYSKERLSEWALAYEQERGQIRCEERVQNNQKRDELRKARAEERQRQAEAAARGHEQPASRPYEPVKHEAVSRDQWIERQVIVDRMKQLRAQMDIGHQVDRSKTTQLHLAERDGLDRNTRAALDHSRAQIHAKYRPRWREVYRQHKAEERLVARGLTHPLERAVFVYRNRLRLGHGRSLGFKAMVSMILTPGKLDKALDFVHRRERRDIAREEKTDAKIYRDRIWASHRERFHTLCERQTLERKAERDHQRTETRDITFARAKSDLLQALHRPTQDYEPSAPRRVRDEPALSADFNHAAWAQAPIAPDELLSRADRIRRDMEIWRRNNPDRDFGHEL